MPRTPARPPVVDPLTAPGVLLMLLEGRAPLEVLSMLAAAPWLRRLPRGDGHPVFVLPGMAANDLSTLPLRRFMRSLGYETQAWGQGVNVGPRRGVVERCADDLRALAERRGQPVSLVGWSLGGVYARELAKQHPDLVRCVITLGTPFTGHPKATHAWRVFQWLSGTRVDGHDPMVQLRQAPPVPTTSIYSRSDGIVAWRCSLNEPGRLAENVAVRSSHMGMGMNPLALYAIADRLAQPVGGWEPFDASGARRWFFRVGSD